MNTYTLLTFGDLIADFKHASELGVFPLAGLVTVAGFDRLVEVDVNPAGGYIGKVDGGNFGEAKTIRGALGAIRRRLQWLAKAPAPRRPDAGSLEARDASLELARRARLARGR